MFTMNPLVERIQKSLDHAGLAWSAAAVKIGLSAQAASNWKKGKIGRETLKNLAKETGVNAGWLLDGEGVMLSDKGSSNQEFIAVDIWDDDTPLDDDEIEIPFFKDFSFACGSGCINEHITSETRKLRMSKATIRNMGIAKDNAVAATASGESMSPIINDGDTIHIDLGRKTIKDGRIFAVCIGGLFYCKRLYNLPFGGVRIVSDNSAEYEEIRLTAEEVKEQEFNIVGWIWQIAKLEKW